MLHALCAHDEKLGNHIRGLPQRGTRAIAHELGTTLSQSLSVELLIEKDLDPAKLTEAFRRARPLPHAVFGDGETALYDRALDETARYVVGIANKLPRFEPTAAGAVLGRLSRMSDEIDQVLEGVARIEHALADAQDEVAARANRFESDYRQAVIRNLDFLELFGADISEEARRYRLSVGYISLTMSSSSGGETHEILNADRLFETLAAGSGRLLIRGEAGSGKSTLLRWAAIDNASLRPQWLHRDSPEFPDVQVKEFALSPGFLDVVKAFADRSGPSATVSPKWYKSPAYMSYVQPTPLTLIPAPKMLFSTFADMIGGSFPVPFLVRLRDCREGKLPSPDELPAQIARELGTPPTEWVKSVLEAGRGLLLLDGVDEVPNSKREDAGSGIRAIVHQYPKCRYVVTSRPTAVAPGWLRDEQFEEAEINPLSDTDRTELIRRWHRAVEDELRRQGRRQDLRPLEDHLIGMLAENPALARLATNPLLCAVMCALHRDRKQVLPESQGELCEAICQLLLHRREAEAGVPLGGFPSEYTALKYKQKRAVLQMIAHHMVDNEESTIAEEDASACTTRTLRQFPDVNEASARVVLKTLIERSGMLRERRRGVVDFVHNTLRDFLSAEVFVEYNDIPKLARHAADDSWRQVVRFAASTDNRSFATKLVNRMLDDAENAAAPDYSRRLRLAAVDCRYAALNMEPATVKRVSGVERTLVPPQTMADAEALAASGDAVVPLLYYREMNEDCAAASVRALRLAGTEHARRVLTGYFADRRPSVIDELSQAVNPLLLDFVRDELRAGRVLNNAIARQITDLRPLVEMTDLELLHLSGWRAVQDITPLRALQNLKTLYLPKIADLSPVLALPSLETLGINWPDASELNRLSDRHTLRALRVSGVDNAGLQAVAHLGHLEALTISVAETDQWHELGKLERLHSLELDRCRVDSLGWLANLRNLKRLELSNCDFDDPAAIGKLRTLEYLTMSGRSIEMIPTFDDPAALSMLFLSNTNVRDLSPITNLTRLRSLGLMGTPIMDLELISNLRMLQQLILVHTGAKNLGPLVTLTNLNYLYIDEDEVIDLNPLSNLCEINTMRLPKISSAFMEVLLRLPNLHRVVIDNAASEEFLRPLLERGIEIGPPPT
jgi:hypothetical protein